MSVPPADVNMEGAGGRPPTDTSAVDTIRVEVSKVTAIPSTCYDVVP
jgi:hypothetical protein